MIDMDSLSEAYKLWNDFRNEIMYKNRYFTTHKVVELIEEIAKQNTIIVEQKTRLFRARLFNENTYYLTCLDNEDSENDTPKDGVDRLREAIMKSANDSEIKLRRDTGFWGYDKRESFVPIDKNKINDGRANPKSIAYLYTAFEEYTAMVEVRPYLKSHVSIATIEPNENLKIADFTFNSISKNRGFASNIQFFVMDAFSKPIDNNIIEYIPTQYISEFIKSLGFDGVKFSSSLNRGGSNLTIFYPEKCEAVSSKLVMVDKIYFEGVELAPNKESKIMHQYLDKLKMKNILPSRLTVPPK